MSRFLVLFLVLFGVPVAAQDDAGALAKEAVAALEAASLQLDEAQSARDRVKALTQTVQAYEDGLEAVRAGLRRATIREEQMRRQLLARDKEIGQLLAALQTITPDEAPTHFLHPAGPIGTVRAGLLLAELTPALNQRAAQLRRDLTDVETLRLLQEQAVKQLQKGLAEVQTARSALNQAMAERTDLPRRFTEDPVRIAILIDSSETLDAFSTGLANISPDEATWEPPVIEDQIGALPMPARGLVLYKPGERDAAGISRPGILLATRPGTLVTSPTAATLRYVGPLLDYGNVTILEPRPGTLFVVAGMSGTYGTTGEIITEGTPLGLMGGLSDADTLSGASTGSDRAGTERSETLYIEVRQDNVPQDPLAWFSTDTDG